MGSAEIQTVMKRLLIILIAIGGVLVGTPIAFAVGIVSGRTAKIVVACAAAILLSIIVFGIVTGRLGFYMERKGPR